MLSVLLLWNYQPEQSPKQTTEKQNNHHFKSSQVPIYLCLFCLFSLHRRKTSSSTSLLKLIINYYFGFEKREWKKEWSTNKQTNRTTIITIKNNSMMKHSELSQEKHSIRFLLFRDNLCHYRIECFFLFCRCCCVRIRTKTINKQKNFIFFFLSGFFVLFLYFACLSL